MKQLECPVCNNPMQVIITCLPETHSIGWICVSCLSKALDSSTTTEELDDLFSDEDDNEKDILDDEEELDNETTA